MTTPADLHALQETDVALDRALARLVEIEEALGESEEVGEARGWVEEKRGRVSTLRARQTDEEWAVEEVRGKGGEVERKLYGGSVRNPKELEDLQADLAAIQGQVRRREDALLATLVEMDEAEGELRAAETELAALEGQWRAGQDALEAEKARLEPEVEQLQAKRSKQAEGMDRATVSLYQLLRERRGGQAVARVERGMCQGCRITLPMSLLQKARTGVGLVQCVSCERILLVN
ncbi:MAG TPA: hypothetical protein VFT91_01675 [Dehalococcoidia bacterium]|nr:hypothetical protein [Dehalococcoidia bacterium]